jgi:hypothetical protein
MRDPCPTTASAVHSVGFAAERSITAVTPRYSDPEST